ncbi:hypothetical protein L195_g042048 [Trifolium pratense]|uniref:Uncharacterized protein n=1 Tax=Trifolium pratense TaxID=57577 RepID=A0A2K3M5E6_TRIPR|nr:hypothetical protein L195_g042048 [Trifolium pratense]
MSPGPPDSSRESEGVIGPEVPSLSHSLILKATTSANGSGIHLVFVEKRESRYKVVTSQPNEEPELFRKLELPYSRPRVRSIRVICCIPERK